VIVVTMLTAALPAMAAEFTLDKAHSAVEFTVKHLAISKVRGMFKDYDATFWFEPGKPESWKVEAVIQAASIFTDNDDRDNHLRSEDFFEVEKYPTINFVSTGVEMTGEDTAKLRGDLTMHGVTKPVVLDLKINGMVEFMGTTKAGFEAETKINRKDFGLTWHKALETGGLVVGDEVTISLQIEVDQVT
jgi:polyisoprenoid-binding protein YceI